MHDATLIYLTRQNGSVREVLLGMKKRGFGSGRFNGFGGKVRPGEDIKASVIRELEEETGIVVNPDKVTKTAELTFTSPHVPKEKGWDQVVHVYAATEWQGEPKESEEMAPVWFHEDKLPYEKMWVDDKHWFPLVLQGKFVIASFAFGKEDNTIEHMDLKTV
jgi:8-oxo-dGTP pyrophosphatase MutT (NUDIX family)